jgi:hypothetical protein
LAKGVRLRLLSLRGSWVQIPSPAFKIQEENSKFSPALYTYIHIQLEFYRMNIIEYTLSIISLYYL